MAAPIATAVVLATVLFLAPGVAERAFAQPEDIGRSLTLPERPQPHWFWLSDILLHRTALFDADTGSLLGTISSGSAGVGFVIFPLFSPDHREIYLAESYFSRGVRGERTDVVTVYDASTLAPLHEISIPPQRAEYFPGNAAGALSDDGRFLAVFNLTPMTSLSIVDVRARRFTGEVPTPGCSLVFAGGPRRFFMLCANGGALSVTLDDEGRAAQVERTAPFFDPQADPITEKAVRRGNEWFFVSFEGLIHPVDVGGTALTPGEPWSLLDAEDRSGSWRVGGAQHLAIHRASGRLYALVHQGGPDTHKDPGSEIWVYDLGSRRRVQRIPALHPVASFVGLQMGGDQRGTTARLLRWVLEKTTPHTGVDAILVTQDEQPVLVAASAMPPAVTIHDALTGEVRREIPEVGIALSLLFAP
jgi:methylamine dehydrogenase heavy chain